MERTFARPDGGVTWALLTTSVMRDDATGGSLLVVQLEDAGDHLLKAAAARIGGALREADVAGRLGGDEFAVICENLDGDRQVAATTAAAVADRIAAALTDDVALDGPGTDA